VNGSVPLYPLYDKDKNVIWIGDTAVDTLADSDSISVSGKINLSIFNNLHNRLKCRSTFNCWVGV
jgi:hypothetical protein